MLKQVAVTALEESKGEAALMGGASSGRPRNSGEIGKVFPI
jgi:hypothetical protein